MGRYSYHEMPLPAQLVEAIESGRWIRSTKLLKRAIPPERVFSPNLYDWEAIERETDAWLLLVSDDEPERVGRVSSKFSPGIVDPYQVVLIGDVDPDMPIALDYRGTADRPCVLYFHDDNCWVKAADSFEEFWASMNDETR